MDYLTLVNGQIQRQSLTLVDAQFIEDLQNSLNQTGEGAIALHEQANDPHAQYAKDSDLSAHTSDQAAHIPDGGITNTLVASDAAIEWSKISKVGAVPSDIGAMPALGTIDQQVGAVKPTTRSGGSELQVGDLWWDTSNLMIWTWNGAYWLSQPMAVRYPSGSINAGTTGVGLLCIDSASFDVFLSSLLISSSGVTTTNDGVNYWTFTLSQISTVDIVEDSSLNTAAIALATRFTLRANLNVYRDVSALNIKQFRLTWAVVGTPGQLFRPSFELHFRYAYP